jgi:hypothetical protein
MGWKIMAKKPTTKKEPAAKKPSLDIKDEMYWADRKKFSWLEEQDPELAKTFSPLIAMKWMSVVEGPLADYYILMTNEMLNLGFWDLSKHPELCWKLMCAAGSGTVQRHGWVPLGSRRKTVSKVDSFFLELYPHLNDEELTTLRGKFTVDSFKQLLKDTGRPDQEIKPLVDEFKKNHG